MQHFANIIRTQLWTNIETFLKQFRDADRAELNWFKQVQHELTVNHETNVILWDSRMGMPAALHVKAVSIAHAWLRQKNFFVKTKKDIKKVLCMHHSKIGQNLLHSWNTIRG